MASCACVETSEWAHAVSAVELQKSQKYLKLQSFHLITEAMKLIQLKLDGMKARVEIEYVIQNVPSNLNKNNKRQHVIFRYLVAANKNIQNRKFRPLEVH